MTYSDERKSESGQSGVNEDKVGLTVVWQKSRFHVECSRRTCTVTSSMTDEFCSSCDLKTTAVRSITAKCTTTIKPDHN